MLRGSKVRGLLNYRAGAHDGIGQVTGQSASLECHVFSNIVQSRASFSTWPWNAVWNAAKYISLITWKPSNKSKPLSGLALIREVYYLIWEPKIPNHPGGQWDSLRSDWHVSVQNVHTEQNVRKPSAASVLERMLDMQTPDSSGE